MTTAQREFGQAAPSLGAPLDRRDQWRTNEGARLRLVLAVAGLAALVAWGALSHLALETTADARGAMSTQDAPRYDGRGKWTGYTSGGAVGPRSFGMPALRRVADPARASAVRAGAGRLSRRGSAKSCGSV